MRDTKNFTKWAPNLWKYPHVCGDLKKNKNYCKKDNHFLIRNCYSMSEKQFKMHKERKWENANLILKEIYAIQNREIKLKK